MPNAIKVGVITQAGGAHLSSYFPALAQTEEVAEVTLADPSGKSEPAARKALGDRLKKTYPDAASLLRDAQPQLALVSLEAVQAPPAIDAALEAGCHVFAEKPACVRAEDFEPLVRKAQRKHRHLMLALANRLHPCVAEARRLLQEGQLGKVYGAELHIVADQTRLKRASYRQEWFAHKARAGGGHLIWLGIHWLDLAAYITGLKVEQVAGFTGVVGGQPLDVEDSAALALRFNNGSFGTMTSGYYLDKGYHEHIQIWGEHGWLRLPHLDENLLEWSSSRGATAGQVQRFQAPKGERGYTPFVRAAVRASAGLAAAPITGEEGLHVLRTIFAAYRAAATGRVQPVST